MRYKCLILDHDDTLVASTQTIHYPSYCEMLKIFRPDKKPLSLSDFIDQCFNPGLKEFYEQTYQFSDEELKQEYALWRDFVSKHTPPVFEGFKELLQDYIQQGGIIVSHTHNHHDIVLRDFKQLIGLIPHEIFSSDSKPEFIKPNTAGIQFLMDKYHLKPQDILMMDDLVYGYDMAKQAGIDFVAPGFGILSDNIRSFFLEKATYFIEKPIELYSILDIKNTIR